MFPVVCVVHSHDGQFAPSLVANAACAVTALFQSVLGAAPDFVPCVAVLRTDPARGTQFLYSASLPDSNHAVRQANVFAVSSAMNSAGKIAEDGDVTSAFLGRSASLVVESLMAGTQPTEIETHADKWNCLAGALLTALCVLNRHGVRAGVAPALAGSGAADAFAASPAARHRGCVLVFSDYVDTGPVSFVAECAFSVAAVALARARVTLSCFGDAVATTAEEGAAALAGTSASARLCGLAASLAGICAPRFTVDQLTMLLAPMSGGEEEDGTSGGNAGAAAPRGGQADAAQRRQNTQRARLTEQYVVTPTMLPQRPTQNMTTMHAIDDKGTTAPAEETAMPGVGWLCPRCMAIVQHTTKCAGAARSDRATTNEVKRSSTDDADEEEDEDDDAEFGVVCPYCDVDL